MHTPQKMQNDTNRKLKGKKTRNQQVEHGNTIMHTSSNNTLTICTQTRSLVIEGQRNRNMKVRRGECSCAAKQTEVNRDHVFMRWNAGKEQKNARFHTGHHACRKPTKETGTHVKTEFSSKNQSHIAAKRRKNQSHILRTHVDHEL